MQFTAKAPWHWVVASCASIMLARVLHLKPKFSMRSLTSSWSMHTISGLHTLSLSLSLSLSLICFVWLVITFCPGWLPNKHQQDNCIVTVGCLRWWLLLLFIVFLTSVDPNIWVNMHTYSMSQRKTGEHVWSAWIPYSHQPLARSSSAGTADTYHLQSWSSWAWN